MLVRYFQSEDYSRSGSPGSGGRVGCEPVQGDGLQRGGAQRAALQEALWRDRQRDGADGLSGADQQTVSGLDREKHPVMYLLRGRIRVVVNKRSPAKPSAF